MIDKDPLTLMNTDGVYVGVMTLNCKAGFSNLTVDYHETSPDTVDAIVPMTVLGISLASLMVMMAKKKNNR